MNMDNRLKSCKALPNIFKCHNQEYLGWDYILQCYKQLERKSVFNADNKFKHENLKVTIKEQVC